MENISLHTLRLPLNTAPDRPHIPILTSSNLGEATRIVLFLGGTNQDLGIFAYRMMVHSINTGSAVNFAKATLSLPSPAASKNKDGKVGLIVGNPGQLIWSNTQRHVVTHANWRALPRKSAIHPPAMIDEIRNRVSGHETVEAHVSTLFEQVLSPTSSVANSEAKISIVALEDTAQALVRYLATNWDRWSRRVEAIVFGDPFYLLSDLRPNVQNTLHAEVTLTAQMPEGLDSTSSPSAPAGPTFLDFISKRSRAYRIARDPKVELDKPCAGRESFGCNCYGSGDEQYSECTMPQAWQAMLNWLKLVWTVGEGFQEVPGEIAAEAGDGGLGDLGWEQSDNSSD